MWQDAGMSGAQATSELPKGLLDFLSVERGGVVALEDLGGMSGARVWRVECGSGPLVAKVSRREAESRFYEGVAPALGAAGVPIPEVYASGHDGGEHWLALEWLPGRFVAPERDVWEPDPGVVAVLARLHRFTRETAIAFEFASEGEWRYEDNTRVVMLLAKEERAAAGRVLEAMLGEGASLRESAWCWISGDASPPNWGRRASGELVLFDWELFRPGTPAEDLAPAVPGLAKAESFRAMARAYLAESGAMGSELPWDAKALARDIVVAKAATVVALLAATIDGKARVPREYRDGVVAAFPGWLAEMGREFAFRA